MKRNHTMTMTPTRNFEVNENVFSLLVRKQSGTLVKAITEGVMNCVDAGSPSIDLTITSRRLTITDLGRGFVGDDEVKNYFSTVGTPHVEGDATFGRFRMGRLTLLRWGVNRWRSNEYQFDVDVKNRGREHDISRGLPHHQGCRIEIDLYDPMTARETEKLAAEVAEWCAWVSIPITVNGKVVSQDPATVTDWTTVTPDAWIKLDEAAPSLVLFNQGIMVTSYGATEFGTGGVITTKPAPARQLDLVYARNAVKTKCPVWRSIRATIKAHVAEPTRRKAMTQELRIHHCRRLMSGELSVTAANEANMRLLTMVDGSHHNLMRFADMAEAGLTSGEATDHRARSVHAGGLGFVLDNETIEHCDATSLDDLVQRLLDLHQTELRQEAIRTNRDFGYTRETIATSQIRASIRSLMRFRRITVDSLWTALSEDSTNISQSALPKGMKSYMRAITTVMKGRQNVANVAVFYSDSGQTAFASNTLFINPANMPDPSSGVDALVQTAALLVSAIVRTNNDAETADVSKSVVTTQKLLDSAFGVGPIAIALMASLMRQVKTGDSSALLMHSEIAEFRATAKQQSSVRD